MHSEKFLKIFTLAGVLQKLSFWWPKTQFVCAWKATSHKALNKPFWVLNLQLFGESFSPISSTSQTNWSILLSFVETYFATEKSLKSLEKLSNWTFWAQLLSHSHSKDVSQSWWVSPVEICENGASVYLSQCGFWHEPHKHHFLAVSRKFMSEAAYWVFFWL